MKYLITLKIPIRLVVLKLKFYIACYADVTGDILSVVTMALTKRIHFRNR